MERLRSDKNYVYEEWSVDEQVSVCQSKQGCLLKGSSADYRFIFVREPMKSLGLKKRATQKLTLISKTLC